MLLPGLLSGLGILVILMQFDFRKVLGYSLLIDIIATGGLTYIFMGTFSGMMTGIFGGLFVSLILAITKRFIGYKRLSFKGWIEHDPIW